MDEATKNAAEEAGFRKTSVSEFLGLSESDKLVVELRRILAAELRKRREDADMTQSDLADRRETTQSRISNLESGEASVSIDALVGALAELGVDREEIGRLIAA